MVQQTKRRATLYALLLIVLLIFVFFLTIMHDKKKVLEEKTSAHRALLRNSYDLAILDTQKGLHDLAYSLASDRNVVDAFADGDRKKLYLYALPYFQNAKRRGEVDTTGFIKADGIHFLRLQSPQKYGDNILIKRPVLAHAIQSRQAITTLDVTLFDVAIVTIIPIYKNNQFLGIIQTVANIDRVQKRLDAHSGIKSAIAFDSKKLHQFLPNTGKAQYQNYTLVTSNDPLFNQLPKSFSFETSQRYMINDKDYVIASRPLSNYQDETIAMMACAFDVTEDVKLYHKEIRNLFVISATLLIIIAIILHYGFQILIRRIDRDAKITRELNEKLSHQLHTDHLTLLPNRNALLKDIHSNRFYALMLLNIDNFKEINDFYGHSVGDDALLALSRSLATAVESFPMKLYKMPSDEFAVALIEPMTSSQLETARLEIVRCLQKQSFNIHGANIYITLTMGMDIAPKGRKTITSTNLLANADMALKSAKKRHLSYMLYDETMLIKQEYQNNILWSKKVKEAIEEKRFCIHYQPIINPINHEIMEYEALIRMIDTDGSIISPGYFLPAAQQSRLYPMISHLVIEEVFKMADTTPHHYSINLSVDDIFDPMTKQYLFEKLRSTPHGNRIIFELLESEGIENYPEVSSFISEVKKFGCRIAIDDFGTGYSNFAHILRLDVDILKIDGSLIRNIDNDTNAQTIVLAVSEFSKRLGLKTVAEFVHSQSVYDKCQELGIDFVQGYYLGEPKALG